MDRNRLSSLRPLLRQPRRAFTLCLGAVPLLGLGCAQFMPSAVLRGSSTSIVRAAAAPVEQPAAGTIVRTAAAEPAAPNVLPINLDTVFRLADGQNALVHQARAKVQEAYAEKSIADGRWLPNIFVGTTYARHEGGIQDFNGRLVHSSYGSLFGGLEVTGTFDVREVVFGRIDAERKLWQSQGELTKVTSEKLLDATETYIDLLSARSGEAIAQSHEKELRDLLQRTENVAAVEPAARVEVQRVQAELTGRQQLVLKLREQAAGASAKLAYLLGIDPCAVLVPVDAQLAPLDLVDATPPTCDLVALALANGPGVREMEGLLALVHRSIEQSRSRANLLPIFEVCMAEGIFGAGPGASNTWDNRWDLALSARWNLTDWVTRCDKQRILDAKMQQVHAAYEDLRGRLTMGVQEAREAIASGREQIRVTQQQIDYARKAYDLSNDRLRERQERASATEVLLSLQSVSLAQLNYLTAVRAYDRAQLRLLLLLGAAPGNGCAK